MDSLAIIKDSSILKEDDLKSLVSLKNELLQTMETAQHFRTRTEMVVSVLKDINFPTPDSKYWQCIREQNGMFHALVMLSYGYRKNSIEIKKLQRDQLLEADELERELMQIEIEKRQFGAINMEREAKDRIREIKEWSDIKSQLHQHMKHGDLDVNAHQLEAMQVSFSKQAGLVNQYTPVADARNILGKADMARKLNPDSIEGILQDKGKHSRG